MAAIKRFEDLLIWQKARQLNKDIVPLLKRLEVSHHFELKNQLDDAMGSVMDNIAEGFERDGNREFIQFLAMSKGSLGESRSQLYRIFDRDLIDQQEFDRFQNDCLALSGKIANFITYLRKSDFRGPKFRTANE
jgi:four helix bundle protein